jgi:phytoene desaturase
MFVSGNKTVAIVGAGMSGLAAAGRLCAGGVTVRLFEANDKVGGCCATTRIEGYTFNDGAVYLVMPQVLDRLFEALGLDRSRVLPLRRISAVQSAILPDGTIVDISEGPELAVISAEGAAETARLQEEMTDFLEKWKSTLRFFADDVLVRPFSLAHLLAGGWRHLAKFRGTAASHLENGFSSEAARAALGGALLYNGVPPDKMPAASLLGLVAMLGDGYHLPEGGMGRIPEVLSDAVRARGGDIHLNSPVRRILVRNGRAWAIEVENEGVVEVDAVISSVSAMHTYGSLLAGGDVPKRMMRKARRAPLSHKSFILQLGLANRIEARSHINCVVPWLGEQAQVFDTAGGNMRWPTYMVPTVTLPELAPEGCSIIELFLPVGRETAPEDWSKARREEFAAQAVEVMRRYHQIDLAASRAMSPREFQDDLHLYAGAVYGLSPVAGPAALFKYRTPIRGLYQAGQTTWPGSGVAGAGMSGVFAAEALIHGESL